MNGILIVVNHLIYEGFRTGRFQTVAGEPAASTSAIV